MRSVKTVARRIDYESVYVYVYVEGRAQVVYKAWTCDVLLCP